MNNSNEYDYLRGDSNPHGPNRSGSFRPFAESMNMLQRVSFDNFKHAVEGNLAVNVHMLLPKIKPIAERFNDEEVQYYYYMALAALCPEECIVAYYNRPDDKYWLSFWTCVALHKVRDLNNAGQVMNGLRHLDERMPEDNLIVLEALTSLIDGDKDTEMFAQSIKRLYSPLLAPVAEVVLSVLNDDGTLPALYKYKFYLDNFLSYAVEMKKRRDEVKRLRDEEERRLQQEEEERRRKEEDAIRQQEQEDARRLKEEEERRRRETEAEAERLRLEAEEMYNKGLDCYNRNDYSSAVEFFRKSAMLGNSNAQNYLGSCYYNGMGVAVEYSEAAEWHRKSAEQGNEVAQFNLGYCYEEGKGVEKNYDEAVKWYTMSAEKEYAYALYKLGECYETGKGIAKDIEMAIEMYEKAAEKNLALAKEKLNRLRH